MPDALDLATLLDPDWREHFRCAEDAIAFYREHSPAVVDEVERELR